MLGWVIGHAGGGDRATRLWCVLAGLLPDLDGLTILFGWAVYGYYHRWLTHNLLFGVGVTLLSARWAGLRARPLALIYASFLSHLVGDYLASSWTLWPFLPFSSRVFVITWESLPLLLVTNVAITLALVAVMFGVAVRQGRTGLELVHAGLDRVLVDLVQLRWRAAPCAACVGRASLRCHACARGICEAHVATWRRLRVVCRECLEAPPG
ncbi:MAG: metal-dependent hydrolase [Candidatus Rokubacteria bacterium]|nr:metal-dependent hydrolase [Candidatus Rokubacteria bacterium]